MRQVIGPLELEYRRDLNIFLCRWCRPVVSSEELKNNYACILEHLKAVPANLQLLDTRRRGYISPEDEAWIMSVFFPTVEDILPGIHYYAYLVTPSIFNHIKNDIGLAKLENLSPGTRVRVFDVERDAINWLRSIK